MIAPLNFIHVRPRVTPPFSSFVSSSSEGTAATADIVILVVEADEADALRVASRHADRTRRLADNDALGRYNNDIVILKHFPDGDEPARFYRSFGAL